MRLVPGFQLRQIDGQTVAVPTGPAAKRLNGLISLNDVGAFLFDRLNAGTDAAALLAALLEEYDAPEPLVRADLDRFLADLRELDLLTEEDDDDEKI